MEDDAISIDGEFSDIDQDNSSNKDDGDSRRPIHNRIRYPTKKCSIKERLSFSDGKPIIHRPKKSNQNNRLQNINSNHAVRRSRSQSNIHYPSHNSRPNHYFKNPPVRRKSSFNESIPNYYSRNASFTFDAIPPYKLEPTRTHPHDENFPPKEMYRTHYVSSLNTDNSVKSIPNLLVDNQLSKMTIVALVNCGNYAALENILQSLLQKHLFNSPSVDQFDLETLLILANSPLSLEIHLQVFEYLHPSRSPCSNCLSSFSIEEQNRGSSPFSTICMDSRLEFPEHRFYLNLIQKLLSRSHVQFPSSLLAFSTISFSESVVGLNMEDSRATVQFTRLHSFHVLIVRVWDVIHALQINVPSNTLCEIMDRVHRCCILCCRQDSIEDPFNFLSKVLCHICIHEESFDRNCQLPLNKSCGSRFNVPHLVEETLPSYTFSSPKISSDTYIVLNKVLKLILPSHFLVFCNELLKNVLISPQNYRGLLNYMLTSMSKALTILYDGNRSLPTVDSHCSNFFIFKKEHILIVVERILRFFLSQLSQCPPLQTLNAVFEPFVGNMYISDRGLIHSSDDGHSANLLKLIKIVVPALYNDPSKCVVAIKSMYLDGIGKIITAASSISNSQLHCLPETSGDKYGSLWIALAFSSSQIESIGNIDEDNFSQFSSFDINQIVDLFMKNSSFSGHHLHNLTKLHESNQITKSHNYLGKSKKRFRKKSRQMKLQNSHHSESSNASCEKRIPIRKRLIF